jgi:peroxin-1
VTGKKVETIQKVFELIFDEAAWRQPSLIFLDDLDHLCGAPSGPEFEMTGEALYSARVAEGKLLITCILMDRLFYLTC